MSDILITAGVVIVMLLVVGTLLGLIDWRS
jgi:preprotein translocase subunit SecE